MLSYDRQLISRHLEQLTLIIQYLKAKEEGAIDSELSDSLSICLDSLDVCQRTLKEYAQWHPIVHLSFEDYEGELEGDSYAFLNDEDFREYGNLGAFVDEVWGYLVDNWTDAIHQTCEEVFRSTALNKLALKHEIEVWDVKYYAPFTSYMRRLGMTWASVEILRDCRWQDYIAPMRSPLSTIPKELWDDVWFGDDAASWPRTFIIEEHIILKYEDHYFWRFMHSVLQEVYRPLEEEELERHAHNLL